MDCKGRYCSGARVKRQVGRGSFAGWLLWICDRCGQVIRMKEAG